MRQEYEDFGVEMPPSSDLTPPKDIPHFTWSELNHGDYNVAFLNGGFLTLLPALRDSVDEPLDLSSGFRNPVHHRYHVVRHAGEAVAENSNNQSGNAADIRTGSDPYEWDFIASKAKTVGLGRSLGPIAAGRPRLRMPQGEPDRSLAIRLDNSPGGRLRAGPPLPGRG